MTRPASTLDPHADFVLAARDGLDQLRPPSDRSGDSTLPNRTLSNWRVLARTASVDLDAGRVVEAHLDAVTIRHALGAGPAPNGSRWGVWAAQSRSVGPLAAARSAGGWLLTGAKPWCSGAGEPRFCTHALVTAQAEDGLRLFALDLAHPGVSVRRDEWRGTGMRASAAATVDVDAVVAHPVGDAGAYLDRPGFWHGACAVAAAWLGGAVAVADPLRRAAVAGRLDDHGRAHLGAVDAALAAARSILHSAAAAVDLARVRGEPVAVAQRRALQVRAVVETAVDTAIVRTGRACGPGPLAHDAEHARRVADLSVYVRQSHAERDLADLGALVPAEDGVL